MVLPKSSDSRNDFQDSLFLDDAIERSSKKRRKPTGKAPVACKAKIAVASGVPLSWNEIRHRAIAFSNEWEGETREAAERQSFWNEFFNVFGVRRRTVATFEEPVKKLSGNWGSIDLFWPGKLLVEHKSAGEDLGKAHAQGMGYIRGLQDSTRDREIPRWLIVSDFQRIAVHDLEPEQDPEAPLFNRVPPSIEFPLKELHKHIHHFAFIAGYTQHRIDPENPANLEATQLMCELHDELKAGGYTGHDLKRFLVRILFCLFAEDTGIFPPKAFELYLKDRTAEDGSDLGTRVDRLFRVLDTPVEARQQNLDESLSEFPYVNGELFHERLEFADFNRAMRDRLLTCCSFQWEQISPAVFGSLFQSVMEPIAVRQIGAHYTAEKNILKVVRSLFMEELDAQLASILADRSTRRAARLNEFHQRLATLRFFDPACGCGNFLVIAYRELRVLELKVLLAIHGRQRELSLEEANALSLLNVHQFHGIEIEEFPARIAEVALWLADHQANIALSEAFSQLVLRLPLRASPHIVVDNALRLDWNTVIPSNQCSYVFGNPPFVGKQFMTAAQKEDMTRICGGIRGFGVLDYVTAWYFKTAEFIQGTHIRCAFVSTNSISQGEQPAILWGELYGRYHLKIQFAHRTFPWESEVRGMAHVHVVIIGFGNDDIPEKIITEYETDQEGHATKRAVANINPYLVEGQDTVLVKRSAPISAAPEISFGSMANDAGHLLLNPDERAELIRFEPAAERFIRPILGSDEFINGVERYCLWLVDASPNEIRELPEILRRVEAVRVAREASKRPTTRELARTPTLFGEIRQPTERYLAVPKTSSERRAYVPMAFLSPDVVANTELFTIPGATDFHFGILSSRMHNAWVRYVCGRLKSDFRYSARIVYNNFPWPQPITQRQRGQVASAARAVLDARAQYQAATLADLYDPLLMPPALARAHTGLDRIVDRCYRSQEFPSDRARVEFLFQLYDQLMEPLIDPARPRRRRRKQA